MSVEPDRYASLADDERTNAGHHFLKFVCQECTAMIVNRRVHDE